MDDPNFAANDAHANNAKMGLGPLKPSKELWAPVAGLTAVTTSEDKVDLPACIGPRFGEVRQRRRGAGGGVGSLRLGIGTVFTAIRSKCHATEEGDAQLLGSQLFASHVLKPGRST